MRACVIFNPAAKGDKARHFRRHLDAIGSACAMKPTWAPGAARTLAADAVRDGFTVVVAAGGDGTVNEVLNGIGDVPKGFARAALGVLPLGTVNVFAKELAIPERVPAAWEIIQAGRERRIDLPSIEFQENGRPAKRYFVQMAGAGLDARAVEMVNWNLKKKIGALAYIWACWQAWQQAPAEITVQSDGHVAKAELVIIGNGRFYGGRYVLWPQARDDDGLLDVCVFPRVRPGTILATGFGVVTGSLHRARGVAHWQAQRVELRASSPTPFHVEGELAGHLPATLTLEPGKLRVVVP